MWNDRIVQMRYRRWKAPREVSRTVSPLGVVLKAGRWYLVARTEDQTRTYRVTNILDLVPLDERFERPGDFDLAEFWQAWARRYEESVYQGEAVIRASAEAMRRLPFNLPPAMARAARAAAGLPDEQGWVETMVPIESLRHGHTELLKFGADIEVLAPSDLRQMFAHSSKALADLYLRTREDAT